MQVPIAYRLAINQNQDNTKYSWGTPLKDQMGCRILHRFCTRNDQIPAFEARNWWFGGCEVWWILGWSKIPLPPHLQLVRIIATSTANLYIPPVLLSTPIFSLARVNKNQLTLTNRNWHRTISAAMAGGGAREQLLKMSFFVRATFIYFACWL